MRPVPPGFDKYGEAVSKAFARITKKPSFRAAKASVDRKLEAEIKWLLSFSEGELADAEWDRLAARLRECALRLFAHGQVFPSDTLDHGFLFVRGWGFMPKKLPPLLSAEEIGVLHWQLKEIVRAFWPRSGEPAIHRVALPAEIRRIHLSNNGKTIKRVYGADWPDWFWVGIAALLEQFGSHIERCQASDCGRLFLRIRRQAYCGTECSQRVRSRRWYETHREEARERRRDAYERQIRKKYPLAKLATRRATTKRPARQHAGTTAARYRAHRQEREQHGKTTRKR